MTKSLLSKAERRLIIAIGTGMVLVLLVLAVLVQAAFTDTSRLRTELEAHFELAVLEDSGKIVRLSRESDSALTFRSTSSLVPGSQLRIPIEVANNSVAHSTRPELTVAVTGHGRVADHTAQMKATVVEHHDGVESVLLGNADESARGIGLGQPATVTASQLSPRSGPAQAQGEKFAGGDTAASKFTVLIALADDPVFRDFQEASWTITITIEGTSGS
ncbi:hypothetical protein [Brevibacterium sp.]|uniref:hypothetical protein n=1 Tax=Brevibacterium sp. TaxID=1701 RepID=UPI00281261C6|nr:hypothetical protein [Brevibacterium sp.]